MRATPLLLLLHGLLVVGEEGLRLLLVQPRVPLLEEVQISRAHLLLHSVSERESWLIATRRMKRRMIGSRTRVAGCIICLLIIVKCECAYSKYLAGARVKL